MGKCFPSSIWEHIFPQSSVLRQELSSATYRKALLRSFCKVSQTTPSVLWVRLWLAFPLASLSKVPLSENTSWSAPENVISSLFLTKIFRSFQMICICCYDVLPYNWPKSLLSRAWDSIQLSFWEKTAVIKKTASPLGKRKKCPEEEPTTTHRLQLRVLRRRLGARLVCLPGRTSSWKTRCTASMSENPRSLEGRYKDEGLSLRTPGVTLRGFLSRKGEASDNLSQECRQWVTSKRKEWAPSSAHAGGGQKCVLTINKWDLPREAPKQATLRDSGPLSISARTEVNPEESNNQRNTEKTLNCKYITEEKEHNSTILKEIKQTDRRGNEVMNNIICWVWRWKRGLWRCTCMSTQARSL